jgi:hypothetical protein
LTTTTRNGSSVRRSPRRCSGRRTNRLG